MKGRLLGAPAPRRVVLRIPDANALQDSPEPYGTKCVPLIDTRGIDGHAPESWFAGRDDLDALLTDQRIPLVVCSSMEDAPDSFSAAVLARLKPGRSVRLVLVDKESASPSARKTKIRQCHKQLSRSGIELPKAAILAIDADRDSNQLLQQICVMSQETRMRGLGRWGKQLELAKQALPNLEREGFALRTRELDLRLRWVWDAAFARECEQVPIALELVADEIERLSHQRWMHAQLYATARRRGRYARLNLIKIGARACARAQGAHVAAAFAQVAATIEQLFAENEDEGLGEALGGY